MRILFDTNVVLDVLLAREPHLGSAAQLFSLVDNGRIEGVISATTVKTIHYIAAKSVGAASAARHLGDLLEMFDVACVDRPVLKAALALDFPDFEDAVLHEAARATDADALVTRNVKDFGRASIPVFDPAELLAAITASS